MSDPIGPRRPTTATGPSLPDTVAPAMGGGPALFYGAIALVAVLYFTRELLVPLALAVLLAFVLAPVARAIRRLGLPRVASSIIAVLLAVGFLSALGVIMGRQLGDLANELPVYQATITRKFNGMFGGGGGLIGRASEILHDLGESLAPNRPNAQLTPQAGLPPLPVEVREPTPGLMTVLQRVVGPLLGPVAHTGIVIVFVIFLLLYREDLRDRLIKLMGSRDLQRTTAALNDAATRLSRYFLAQTALNAGFGVVITIGLWAIGIPNPILWGVIAGLMRFVPFIGGFIAAAFPLLLAVAVDPGWTMLPWVLALFLITEPLMGQVFEPLVYGHSTGLSPVAVLLATAFWAWLWGPIGLLVATPLTVGLVVLGRHIDQLEFLDVLLGDRAALEPAEAFYQRALAGDGDGLAEQAELQLRTAPLAAYYDTVALPGLSLAQEDATRGALDRDRLGAVRDRVAVLLDELSDHEDAPQSVVLENGPVTRPDEGEAKAAEEVVAEEVSLPPAWRAREAVLCVAGRGRLDDQATAMLAQVLSLKGIGTTVLHNDALRDPELAARHPGARVVVISALEGGSGAASARYALRRLRRRFPDATLVAGVWGAERDSRVLAALREEAGGADSGVVEAKSLREALQLCLTRAQEEAGIAPPAEETGDFLDAGTPVGGPVAVAEAGARPAVA
ncbi:AI-2E family transporter [Muricoccus radiodurans]|uniref:AI-2E family transporter n=1 Tax=Muricoccus radiodurans TaxID=2231721 RepID=UPI003CE7BC56